MDEPDEDEDTEWSTQAGDDGRPRLLRGKQQQQQAMASRRRSAESLPAQEAECPLPPTRFPQANKPAYVLVPALEVCKLTTLINNPDVSPRCVPSHTEDFIALAMDTIPNRLASHVDRACIAVLAHVRHFLRSPNARVFCDAVLLNARVRRLLRRLHAYNSVVLGQYVDFIQHAILLLEGTPEPNSTRLFHDSIRLLAKTARKLDYDIKVVHNLSSTSECEFSSRTGP